MGRVVVDGDSITHPGHALGIYQHSGTQVLVDADCLGNVIVDPVTIETLGRRPTKASIHYHKLRTYRDCLEACLEDEDPRKMEQGETGDSTSRGIYSSRNSHRNPSLSHITGAQSSWNRAPIRAVIP